MKIFEFLMQPGSFDLFLDIGIIVLKIAIVIGVVMFHVAYATYFERKVIGHMQLRMGPMEVGQIGRAHV